MLALLKTALVAAVALSTSVAAAGCNGQQEFCSRSYSNVSVIGTHNSYGVAAGSIAANQNYTIKTQLDNGVRMLQVQAHMNGNDIHLCHSSCLLLDAGTFTTYLTTVKNWLDSNPTEVITILIVNSDGIAPSSFASAYEASGMTSYAYTPSSVPIAYSDWPTLQSLINSGKRAVNFLAQNADISAVPYLLDEFTNIWETPYGETNAAFPCPVDRVTGSSEGKMYLVNHYLDRNVTLLGQTIPVPDTDQLKQTNAATGYGSLGTQADTCFSNWGYLPTFTLVDYYDVGNGSVFEYTAALNGVNYVATTIGNGSTSSNSSSKGSSSGNGAVSSTPLGGAGSLLGQLWTSQSTMAMAVLGLAASFAL